MTFREDDIYAAAAMRSLLADETPPLQAHLKQAGGLVGLQISAAPRDPVPAAPQLRQWARLRLDARGYRGDLRAAAGEALPFGDESFDVVLLRHALEVAPSARDLLGEAVRVLAPGGMLLLTGVHPWSLWTPWCWAQRRGTTVLRSRSPLLLGAWLHAEALVTERVERVGTAWPMERRTDAAHARSWLGGGYVMLAHKRPPAGTPLTADAPGERLPAAIAIAPAAGGCTAPAALEAR